MNLIMNKELESLEYLKNRITTLSLNHKIGNRDIAKREVSDIVKGIEIHVIPTLEKALTPPTADEVCKALSEWFGERVGNVFYVEETKIFRSEEYANLGEYLFDSEYLDKIPPHLITMIGRFYEGEIK